MLRDIRRMARQATHDTFKQPVYLVPLDGEARIIAVRINRNVQRQDPEQGLVFMSDSPTILIKASDVTQAELSKGRISVGEGEAYEGSFAGEGEILR